MPLIRLSTLSATMLCMGCAYANAASDTCDAGQQAGMARGRATLRAMDCARCHGRDHAGWTAPSLIAAVRDGSRERFVHFVLEGDPARGMPGYRSQPRVVADLDGIYAYLRASGETAVPAASPASGATPPCARETP